MNFIRSSTICYHSNCVIFSRGLVKRLCCASVSAVDNYFGNSTFLSRDFEVTLQRWAILPKVFIAVAVVIFRSLLVLVVDIDCYSCM